MVPRIEWGHHTAAAASRATAKLTAAVLAELTSSAGAQAVGVSRNPKGLPGVLAIFLARTAVTLYFQSVTGLYS
jgi:hypothetical protein